ncbi:MAG: hypothetical protein ETSY1_35065 [Candidatus Entotheonella factor]|uniref:Bacterial surface antigen (D15) domain-containing protein n=1 Tax=Entotheonella factor TaxID=1429438 RepID=W4L932_ENTF1|nr:BamA/TamA family outer membrane protein [Candidatus Entotheonella palauensis]ETW94394.1 MAG: hypothetical protein ETSY1_35065 [Candidatus Entotheonella factor]
MDKCQLLQWRTHSRASRRMASMIGYGTTLLLFSLIYCLGIAAETRTVTADASLRAWGVHKWLLGANYRDLWTTPIEVEVLNLQTEAGGLRPLFRVGGLQTFGLAMAGADGRSYTFRGLVKDLGQSLPEDFQGYLIDDFVQDQLAALLPGAPVMVPPLAEAAGVYHTVPRLVIMPDDPALGEFRHIFAGMLGTLEEFPTPVSDQSPGFHGATEILSTKKFWPHLVASPATRIDVRAFLRARLFDFFIGDWDRHANQWRWMKLPGNPLWQPFPEDRDVAFSDYEGALINLYRPFRPTLLTFREQYPTRAGLTLQGWQIHRWILPALEKADWLAIAADLQERMTDEVIEAAVRRLPEPWYAWRGPELVAVLKKRRDRLSEIAERVYRFQAAEADVQATDQSERVELRDLGQGSIDVRVMPQEGTAPEPYLQRGFHPEETTSLRIYLRQGEDILVCHAPIRSSIRIEVIGNPDSDVMEGCEEAKIRFTDIADIERRQQFVRKKPDPLSKTAEPESAPPIWQKPRDWRYQVTPIYWINGGSDLGLLIGGGLTVERYAFAKAPFAERHAIKAGYATGLNAFEASYTGAYQHWNPRLLSMLDTRISGLERINFFGFGNETSDEGPDDFFKTDHVQYRLAYAMRYILMPQLDLIAGGRLTYTSTDDDDDTLLNRLQPYGVGDFGQFSLFAGFEFDTRDRAKRYGPGVFASIEGALVPEVWDVESTFGALEGEVAGYLALSPRILLTARISGRHVFGTFPFQEAAYIGGNDSLRAYSSDRFAGDASILANAEMRLILGQTPAILFRAEWGVFGFGDVGRVFLDGEDSDRWHPAGGGGLFAATRDRSLLWSLTVARSEEQTSYFFKANFSF